LARAAVEGVRLSRSARGVCPRRADSRGGRWRRATTGSPPSWPGIGCWPPLQAAPPGICRPLRRYRPALQL